MKRGGLRQTIWFKITKLVKKKLETNCRRGRNKVRQRLQPGVGVVVPKPGIWARELGFRSRSRLELVFQKLESGIREHSKIRANSRTLHWASFSHTCCPATPVVSHTVRALSWGTIEMATIFLRHQLIPENTYQILYRCFVGFRE
jgi:hypothetical protein